MRLGKSVVNVGTQRLKGNGSFVILLGTRDLRAVQSACDHGLDTLHARLGRSGHRHLHRSAEAGPLLELICDIFRNKLRFRVRRPRAEWERLQARIFALDPLGRHSGIAADDILDWGLAKRLESEALRKLPEPDFESLRKIVFPASLAKAKENPASGGGKHELRNAKAEFNRKMSDRLLCESPLVTDLGLLVGVLMGDDDTSGETYYCSPSAYSDYDDFYF